jgi:hypothetical protein
MNEAAMTDSGRVRSHRFTNRFAGLEPYDRDDEFLENLGGVNAEEDTITGPMLGKPGSEDDADISAGIAFFGQFIDHEITFDPTSAIDSKNDPEALRNFRTPALDLDSMYGSGPEVRPFLYDMDDPDEAKLLTGPTAGVSPTEESEPRALRFGAADVQRNDQGSALIVDPRNDENVIISQLLLTFLKFHNRVVDYIRSGDGRELVADSETQDDEGGEGDGTEDTGSEELDIFAEAERIVRWHYQWLALHKFLPQVCDNTVLDNIFTEGRRFFIQPDTPVAVPVEFAGAAYRYGHSQIRDRYTVNSNSTDVQFFPGPTIEDSEDMRRKMQMMESFDGPPPGIIEEDAKENLNGFEPVPNELAVEWPYFFDYQPDDAGDDSKLQFSREIDAELPPALFLLPFIDEGLQSLAARNLRRGKALGLPSGQALARAMDIDPLANDALPLGDGSSFGDYLTTVHRGTDPEAPLWLYVLAEADAQNDGNRLGAVGSRVVGEVIHGLVTADENAFINRAPDWRPTLPREVSETDDDPEKTAPYRFADLLVFATGPAPDGLVIDEIDADGTGSAPDTPEDDPTNGESVILKHTGAGELPIDGYEIDYDEQTETIGNEDDDSGSVEPLQPDETLVVYTGDGPSGDPGVRTFAHGRGAAVINDHSDTVTVRTQTGEVSAFSEHQG